MDEIVSVFQIKIYSIAWKTWLLLIIIIISVEIICIDSEGMFCIMILFIIYDGLNGEKCSFVKNSPEVLNSYVELHKMITQSVRCAHSLYYSMSYVFKLYLFFILFKSQPVHVFHLTIT